MEKTRRADLSRAERGYVSHNVAAASRNTRDTKLILEKQKLNNRRQAKYVKGPEAYHPVPHHVGLAPIAVAALMIGFVLLFFFILTMVPWGFGNGCWAQC